MRTTSLALLTVLVLGTAACGSDPDQPTTDVAGAPADDGSLDDAVTDGGGADPSAGMCAPGVSDCVDADLGDGGEDVFDSEIERETARAMLGLAEEELAPDVRVSRRGDEQLALTEDYRLGRKTVELDPDADGTFRVVSVTIELPDGPETVTE